MGRYVSRQTDRVSNKEDDVQGFGRPILFYASDVGYADTQRTMMTMAMMMIC
jgi:hypothetical protein